MRRKLPDWYKSAIFNELYCELIDIWFHTSWMSWPIKLFDMHVFLFFLVISDGGSLWINIDDDDTSIEEDDPR